MVCAGRVCGVRTDPPVRSQPSNRLLSSQQRRCQPNLNPPSAKKGEGGSGSPEKCGMPVLARSRDLIAASGRPVTVIEGLRTNESRVTPKSPNLPGLWAGCRRWPRIRGPAVESPWQELTRHIECGFHSECNPQGAPSVLGTSRAGRLPCPRDEGNSGIAANSRERQVPGSVGSVVPSSHGRTGCGSQHGLGTEQALNERVESFGLRLGGTAISSGSRGRCGCCRRGCGLRHRRRLRQEEANCANRDA